MTTENNAQPVLTDDEILTATLYGQSGARMIRNGRAIESAVLSKLRAPVADERAALTWYAEQVAGCRKFGPVGEAARSALDKDGGERARAALASAPVAKPWPAGWKLVPIDPTPDMIEAGATERITPHASAGHGAVAGYKAMLAAAPVSAPVAQAEVMAALDWLDDFVARCNGDDRGSCESVNVLRRALAGAPVAGEAQEHYDEVKATLQGAHRIMEGVSAIERRAGPIGSHARGYTHKITNALRHLDALYAAPQASEAVRSEQDATGRTPTDYALEFAEYLARDAEYAMACLNASQRANESLLDLTEKVASSEAYQAAEEAAADADEAFTGAITGLQFAVFEFRKRRDRAALSAQPADKPAISSPSSAGNPCPEPVPAYPETGNSHTDGGAVYG